jgi:hypothetical protein
MRHNTPRHGSRTTPRGIGTLIGNGWLRDAPKAPVAHPQGRSALRKCHFLVIPDELKALAPPVSRAAMPPAPARPAAPVADVASEPRRRDPERDARAFPVFPMPFPPVRDARAAHAHAGQRAAYAPAEAAGAWWEDPIALGSLLVLCPPIGVAAVWTSRRYSTDARWALTVMTALMMCLVSAVVLALIAFR